MMPFDSADVVVVGGGVSGLSAAWWLARGGVDVLVVDKGVVGWEASGRNGGSVAHRGSEPPVVPIAAESMRLWPTMDDELGYPTEFARGRLDIALDDRSMARARQTHAGVTAVGVRGRIIDAAEVRDLVPLASPDARGGLLTTDTGHANPQRTVQAYAWALQDHGGRILQHTAVDGFGTRGGRVTSVETSRGEIATDYVVCAAGPQTGILAEKVGIAVPLAPARVEIVVTAPVEPMWTGMVAGNGLYGRQTRRGNLAYGGGAHEWIDIGPNTPDKPNTPLVRNIASRLAELLSGAADVPMIRSWAGVVEQTPDGYPVIEVPETPSNFLVATVSGHGFGLSPATGMVIRDLVLHGETPVDVSGLHLGRFAGLPTDWRERLAWEAGRLGT